MEGKEVVALAWAHSLQILDQPVPYKSQLQIQIVPRTTTFDPCPTNNSHHKTYPKQAQRCLHYILLSKPEPHISLQTWITNNTALTQETNCHPPNAGPQYSSKQNPSVTTASIQIGSLTRYIHNWKNCKSLHLTENPYSQM